MIGIPSLNVLVKCDFFNTTQENIIMNTSSSVCVQMFKHLTQFIAQDVS